jgi:hypothetical protein
VIHLHLTVPVVADPPSSKVPVPTHHRQYHRPFIDSATPRKSSITGLSSLTGHVHVVDTVRTPSKYLQSLFSSTLVNYSPPSIPSGAFLRPQPFLTTRLSSRSLPSAHYIESSSSLSLGFLYHDDGSYCIWDTSSVIQSVPSLELDLFVLKNGILYTTIRYRGPHSS